MGKKKKKTVPNGKKSFSFKTLILGKIPKGQRNYVFNKQKKVIKTAFDAIVGKGGEERFAPEPWVNECFTKDFAHMIQLGGIILEDLDFSQPFRMEIDYDPEQLRTTVKTFMPTEVLQSRIQKAMGTRKG